VKTPVLIFALVALSGATLAGAPALAAVTPQPSAGDPRMRVAKYVPEEVVELVGDLGYQMTIEFGDGERIENVSIGDAQGWQVTPNRKADLLFLKPIDAAVPTNMTVVTNLRRYAFELRVRPKVPRGAEDSIIYGVRFDYPPPPPTPAAVAKANVRPPPQVANAAYSYEGSAKSLPSRVFDDGKSTYFQFAEGDDYPAIYAVESDKAEAVVNYTVRDGYVIVDQIARGFVLRRGADVTRLYNDGFHETLPGPLSPKPRLRPRWWEQQH
jgi:type IV secretion system protein VirB9